MKVAVVSGGATGIGAGIGARLADDGSRVVLGTRTQQEADAALARLAAPGRELVAVAADLATPAGCRGLVAAAVDRYGRIDVLVNNAAVTGPEAMAPFAGYDDERLDAVVEVNLKAPFRCAREAVAHMSSGYAAQQDASAYVAAKAGLVGLTRALGFELAERGIRVVHVAPGDIVVRAEVPAASPFARRTPLGRRGAPADVAAAVAWLCGPDASFVTGTGLVVDGGWTSY
jgi:NAD(P)-dependent dehydrogenase (short-subunit alcohol dehydrogenase family)